VIEFTFAEGYPQLEEIIKAHGYGLARRSGVVLAPLEAAADWYDTVYLACVEAVRRAGLPELSASWRPTEADLVLWVYKLRRDSTAATCPATVALVTGAGAGMGLDTARAFATAGAAVVLADVNDDAVRAAADELT
jgi:hypothetical protein